MNKLIEKYYKFPLVQFSSYIFDSDNQMCLMYCTHIDDESKRRGLSVLNGESGITFNSKKKTFSVVDGEIFFGDIKFMMVRGWGRFRYIKDDKPELIQDAFGQWVVDTLNNYEA